MCSKHTNLWVSKTDKSCVQNTRILLCPVFKTHKSFYVKNLQILYSEHTNSSVSGVQNTQILVCQKPTIPVFRTHEFFCVRCSEHTILRCQKPTNPVFRTHNSFCVPCSEHTIPFMSRVLNTQILLFSKHTTHVFKTYKSFSSGRLSAILHSIMHKSSFKLCIWLYSVISDFLLLILAKKIPKN